MIEYIIGIMFALIGIIVLIVGLMLYFKKKSEIKHWIETTGKVVGFESKNQDCGYGLNAELYSPIVEFQGNYNSVSYANKIYLARRYVSYKVGDTVTVLYNPNDNYEYYIKSDKMSIYQTESKFIMFGGAFAVVGLMCPLILGHMSMAGNIVMRRALILLAPVIMALCVKHGNTPK